MLDGWGGMHAFALGVGPPQLNVSVFLDTLANPWDIAFTPDGWVVYAERPNGISAVRADGTAASDNPVYSPSGDPRIFSYGHRNVQGIAFAPSHPAWNGISIEHGPSIDDEANRLVPGSGSSNSRPMARCSRRSFRSPSACGSVLRWKASTAAST